MTVLEISQAVVYASLVYAECVLYFCVEIKLQSMG